MAAVFFVVLLHLLGAAGTGNWIRRFEEIDDDTPRGAAPGAVWAKRVMTPGGESFVSRFRQDKFVFDPAKHAYVIDPKGSTNQMQTVISVAYAQVDWGTNNRSGFDLDRVLRLTSQWQREGKMVETYDYARGKGMVNWRWLERLSTLKPLADDLTGKVFHCEEGAVVVEDEGDAHRRPIVRKYLTHSGKPGDTVEVVQFTSGWKPELGPQWYVVYRDLAKEGPLLKRNERIAHNYSLPEWTAKPAATIKDLPYLNTHPPQ